VKIGQKYKKNVAIIYDGGQKRQKL